MHFKYCKLRISFVARCVLAPAILIGCGATIPKDSVTLSKEIGKSITENKRAYVNLLNNYFLQKRQILDDKISSEFVYEYIDSLKKEIRKVQDMASGEPIEFDDTMVKDIVHDVIEFRDSLQLELENARIRLMERVLENYAILIQANANITGLLQSAVDIEEAVSSMKETIQTATKGVIDFEKLDKKFNDWLEKTGDLSGKGSTLLESIEPLIYKNGD